MNCIYTSQTRLDFDINSLLHMGIKQAYVTPFISNNECLVEPEVILADLEELSHKKADTTSRNGLEVYPVFVTINHLENNFEVPLRYRRQHNLDGFKRPVFICFRDPTLQDEMIQFAAGAVELGFARIVFDKDLCDSFCYCDEHPDGFKQYRYAHRTKAHVESGKGRVYQRH